MQLLLMLDIALVLVLLGVKAHRMWAIRQIRAQRARDIRLFWLLYHAFHPHQK
jgi:hypothetical protein